MECCWPSCCRSHFYWHPLVGCLAQSVERWNHNPQVAGSNPAAATIFFVYEQASSLWRQFHSLCITRSIRGWCKDCSFSLLWKSQVDVPTFSWFSVFFCFEWTYNGLWDKEHKPLPTDINSLHLLLSYTVSVLRSETENRTLLLTAAGAFRKPDENGPSSSSESGFGELNEILRHPVPHFAVPFKSSTRKLSETS